MTLTVTEVGDPPVAVADAVTTNEDQAVVVAVTANDSDVDSGPLSLYLTNVTQERTAA